MADLTQEQFIDAIAERVVARLTPLLPAAQPAHADNVLERRNDGWWYVNGRKDHYDPHNLGFYESATPIKQPAKGAAPTTFVDPLDGKTYPLPDRLKGIAAPFGYYFQPGVRVPGMTDGMFPKSAKDDIGL